jgi:hypothetical protein
MARTLFHHKFAENITRVQRKSTIYSHFPSWNEGNRGILSLNHGRERDEDAGRRNHTFNIARIARQIPRPRTAILLLNPKA